MSVLPTVFEKVEPPATDGSGCKNSSSGLHDLESSPHCDSHWDNLLCWPQAEANTTLAIFCNASKSFVEIVTTARPGFRPSDIPGKGQNVKIQNEAAFL